MSAWARRDKLLVAAAGISVPLIAISQAFHQKRLFITGVVVLGIGTIGKVLIELGRSRQEHRLELVISQRQLLVRIGPCTDIEPTSIGVDVAAQGVLKGEQIPEYVARDVDAELQEALAHALDGRGPWFVAVVGPSKVGKSRSLFEALRMNSSTKGMPLVAPASSDELGELLLPGNAISKLTGEGILWLDDIETFLAQGITMNVLSEWHMGGDRRIVVATYGGKGNDLIHEAAGPIIETTASSLLSNSREVHLSKTTEQEVASVTATMGSEERSSVHAYGLAAFLVAGPALERKLHTGRHAPGEDASPGGLAVVKAACDWARCGRTDPIGQPALRELWDKLLSPTMIASEDFFSASLEWALRPVAGPIALLERGNGIKAYDYVVKLERERTPQSPDALAWDFATQGADFAAIHAVGFAALEFDRLDTAIDAFDCARQSPQSDLASLAGLNMGIVLQATGGQGRATEVYRQVFAAYGRSTSLDTRVNVARALVNEAYIAGQDDPQDELSVASRVVDLYGEDSYGPLREQVVRALTNMGVVFRKTNNPEEALKVYERVLSEFLDDRYPPTRLAVAKCLSNLALLLAELGNRPRAVEISITVANIYGKDPEAATREAVAGSMLNRGAFLASMDLAPDELSVYDELVEAFGADSEESVRVIVASALYNKGYTLNQLGRLPDEVQAYDEVVVKFGSDLTPSVREQVAKSLVSQGLSFEDQSLPDGALGSYRDLARRYGNDTAATVRRQVAKGLSNRGVVLQELGRVPDAIDTFRHIVATFGNDHDSETQLTVRYAAEAIRNLQV